MKTPEEIKKALNVCCNGIKPCQAFNGETCPYLDDSDCLFSVNSDALEYIERLEERIAIMEEGQKHGAWIDEGENPDSFMGAHKAKCSECGYEVWAAFADQLHFCPNCGAKMDMDIDETDA